MWRACAALRRNRTVEFEEAEQRLEHEIHLQKVALKELGVVGPRAVRLLLLSRILECESLYEASFDVIVRSFDVVGDCPEWQSPFLEPLLPVVFAAVEEFFKNSSAAQVNAASASDAASGATENADGAGTSQTPRSAGRSHPRTPRSGASGAAAGAAAAAVAGGIAVAGPSTGRDSRARRFLNAFLERRVQRQQRAEQYVWSCAAFTC